MCFAARRPVMAASLQTQGQSVDGAQARGQSMKKSLCAFILNIMLSRSAEAFESGHEGNNSFAHFIAVVAVCA